MAAQREETGVRVLLANPGPVTPGAPNMARKRRRTRTRSTRRRPIRRRRNPKTNMKGAAMAVCVGALGGVAMAGADYALDGFDKLEQKHQGLVEMAAGLLLGGVAAMFEPRLGAALAAGGFAVGGANALQGFIAAKAATPATTGAIYGRRQYAQLHAVQAPLGAVSANIGQGANVEMGAVHAVMNAIGR